jgi:hypothetical protein
MFVVPSIMSAVNAQVNAYNQAMAQMNSMAQYQNSLLAQSQPFQPGQMIPCDQYHQLCDRLDAISDKIAMLLPITALP